jgi:hypothetical protein
VAVVVTATGVTRPAPPMAPVTPISAEDLDDVTTPDTEPDTSPVPLPGHGAAPPPTAVTGHLGAVEVVELAIADSGLFQPDQVEDTPPVIDATALAAGVDGARRWLDDHLTTRSGVDDPDPDDPDPDDPDPDGHDPAGDDPPDGLRPPLAAGGAATPSPARPLPDDAAVEYHVVAGVRGVPEWLDVEVLVASEAGTWRERVLLAVHDDGSVAPLARDTR